MLHSSTPVQVRLQPEAFIMMENLKFLIVCNVEISEALTYFPESFGLKLQNLKLICVIATVRS